MDHDPADDDDRLPFDGGAGKKSGQTVLGYDLIEGNRARLSSFVQRYRENGLPPVTFLNRQMMQQALKWQILSF